MAAQPTGSAPPWREAIVLSALFALAMASFVLAGMCTDGSPPPPSSLVVLGGLLGALSPVFGAAIVFVTAVVADAAPLRRSSVRPFAAFWTAGLGFVAFAAYGPVDALGHPYVFDAYRLVFLGVNALFALRGRRRRAQHA